MSDDVILYESDERGCFYNCIRVLWCNCCEDSHKITEKYVRIHRWEGCTTVTDSMAMEAISDVSRTQSCGCFCSSCICGCCIYDMGDLKLYGKDETSAHGLKLKNVANSKATANKITKHLQHIHADFRQNAKNFGTKLQQQKAKLAN